MTFFVEVLQVHGERQLVEKIIAATGYSLKERHDGGTTTRVLSHDKYATAPDASWVNDDAKELGSNLAQLSTLLGESMGLTFGPVQQVHADGRTNKHIFVQVAAVACATAVGHVAIGRNPDISDEERRRLEAEAAARAEKERKQKIARKARAALRDTRIIKVMQLMAIKEPNTTQLGQIVELVEEACRTNFQSFMNVDPITYRLEVQRFHDSINNSNHLGLDARHATSRDQPRSDAMSLPQATEFARSLGTAWLAQFHKQ